MGLRFEEKRAAEVCAFRDDDNATSLLGCLVDDRLDFLGLEKGAVVDDTVFKNVVFLTICLDIDNFILSEPVGNGSSIREFFFC